ncbi:MAG: hypothetical protein KAH24_06945 [Holophagae bacterium]|nr:hypothetical protein [Holophagae bacterium]
MDFSLEDLTDPAEMAKYTRADIVIVQCDQFWGRDNFEGRMALLRAAKPELKIIGFFRSKAIKTEWGLQARGFQTYNYDLYQASKPYWCSTTTGDTLMDWPEAVVYDYTNPAARKAMLDVYLHYNNSSSNKFDGMYWDYFNEQLWIAPAVTTMEGDPDMDGDGVGHWDDADEKQAFRDAQYDWIDEVQRAMGPDFIQIANGSRALTDSLFASKFDGMFYELFPNVGYGSGANFKKALDPNRYNNLWAARNWPRTVNGGPWLILSHAKNIGSYRDEDGAWKPINSGNLLRAVALLTGATSTHYDGSGLHSAGLPEIELDLGAPLGPVSIIGTHFSRQFERGRVELEMGDGYYPFPFAYAIPQNGVVVESFGEMVIDP